MNSGDKAATQPSPGAFEDPSHDSKCSHKGLSRSKVAAGPSAARPGSSAQASSAACTPRSMEIGPPLLYTARKCEHCKFCARLGEISGTHVCSKPNSSPLPLTPLRLAALLGDARRVRALLAGGADPNEHFPFKRTVLHCAAAAGYGDVVGALLAAGADPDVPDTELGRTPLHSACSAGHAAVAQRLVAAGARVDVRAVGELPREAAPEASDTAAAADTVVIAVAPDTAAAADTADADAAGATVDPDTATAADTAAAAVAPNTAAPPNIAAGPDAAAAPDAAATPAAPEAPRQPPSDRARDEMLAAALVIASMGDPEMNPNLKVSARILARKWWRRRMKGENFLDWLKKRK